MISRVKCKRFIFEKIDKMLKLDAILTRREQ